MEYLTELFLAFFVGGFVVGLLLVWRIRYWKHKSEFYREQFLDAFESLSFIQNIQKRQMEENMDNEMIQVDKEWESTRICPCGASFGWSGYDENLEKWMKKHQPHTNGMLRRKSGDDWDKVYGEKPETKITDL